MDKLVSFSVWITSIQQNQFLVYSQRQFHLYPSCKHKKKKNEIQEKNNFVPLEGSFFWLLIGKLIYYVHSQWLLIQEISKKYFFHELITLCNLFFNACFCLLLIINQKLCFVKVSQLALHKSKMPIAIEYCRYALVRTFQLFWSYCNFCFRNMVLIGFY